VGKKMVKRVKVTVTGGAGGICYSLLFRLASGEVFGSDTYLDLIILEIPQGMNILKGVAMELQDCAFPLLLSITLTESADCAFDGIDYAFLVGSRPRSKGMERSDLLLENGKIFVEQGRALNRSPEAKVLVVGNPCNTNALILKHAAKNLPSSHICAMTRLDRNRATAMIAEKAKVGVNHVQGVAIFGNHSSTMVIDYLHATIKGKHAVEVIGDIKWFQEVLFPQVQQRGAAVLEARGHSSAASAANAAIDALKDWIFPSKEISCSAMYSQGNSYGIDGDLFFSFPTQGGKRVEGLKMDEFLLEKIKLSEKELIEERDIVKTYLR